MRTHTSEFKNKIKEFGRELDSVITINGTTMSSEDIFSITPLFSGSILKSVMRELDIEIKQKLDIGTTLNYKLGVKVRNEEVTDYRKNYDYIDYGEYIVYSCEKKEDTDTYNIVCFDKMLYTMKDYKLSVTYPITVRNYINSICSTVGLTFENASSTFANYDKQIKSDVYAGLGYTYRDVLDELAQVTASTICINSNGKLEIRYITDTKDTIDEEYIKDTNVTFGEKYGPVNSIVFSRSADSDTVHFPSVVPDNPIEIKIKDNQILNDDDRSQYLSDIYTKLNGLEFYINDYSSTGICYYDLCDRYNVQIGNNTYSCIMLNDEVDVTQGLEESIYTEKLEESVTDYTKSDTNDKKVALIVDKQNKTISAVVSTVNGLATDTTLEKEIASYPIEITDALNTQPKEDIVYGNSYQAETPTPDNPSTIYNVGVENLYSAEQNFNISQTDSYHKVYLKANTTYTISFTKTRISGVTISNNTIYKFATIRCFKSDGTVISNISSSTVSFPSGSLNITQTFTTPDGLGYVGINFGNNNGDNNVNTLVSNIMIEPGTVSHDYVDYGHWLIQKSNGKNLFDKNNETKSMFYTTSDGSINTSATVWSQFNFIDVNPNVEYTISDNYIESNNSFEITMFDDNHNWVRSVQLSLQNGYLTFTTPNNVYYIRIGARNDRGVIDSLQLEKSSTATDYEEYKETKTIISLDKENLFDDVAITNDYVISSDGSISVSKNYCYTDYIPVTSDRNYGCSWDETTDGEDIMRVAYYDSSKTFISRPIKTGSPHTFTTPSNCTYIRLSYAYNVTSNISLYEYEPFSYYELNKIGDISDEINLNTGVLTKRIGKVVLNGSESWEMAVSGRYHLKIKSSPAGVYTYDSMCSHFVNPKTWDNHLTTDNSLIIANIGWGAGNCRISVRMSAETTLTNFKTWLSSNPITVYYVLDTPENIQLEKKAEENEDDLYLEELVDGLKLRFDFSKLPDLTYETTTTDTSGTIIIESLISPSATKDIIKFSNATTGEEFAITYINRDPSKLGVHLKTVNIGNSDSSVTLYDETQDPVLEINEYTIPDGFGTVTSIDTDYAVDGFVKVITEKESNLYEGYNYLTVEGNINPSNMYLEYITNCKFNETYATKQDVTSAKSELIINENEIKLEVSKKVGNDEIISKINQSAEEISIEASKINLNGAISANETFKIDTDGTMSATGGTIGGATIDSSGIYTGSGSATAGIGKIGDRYAFWAGSENDKTSSAPFHVGHDGVLTASRAIITGTINSSDGSIGGWNLNSDGLSNTSGFYVKNNGVSNVYTMSDILICRLILQGTISCEQGTPEFSHFDVNGDGVINSQDLLIIRQKLQ